MCMTFFFVLSSTKCALIPCIHFCIFSVLHQMCINCMHLSLHFLCPTLTVYCLHVFIFALIVFCLALNEHSKHVFIFAIFLSNTKCGLISCIHFGIFCPTPNLHLFSSLQFFCSPLKLCISLASIHCSLLCPIQMRVICMN